MFLLKFNSHKCHFLRKVRDSTSKITMIEKTLLLIAQIPNQIAISGFSIYTILFHSFALYFKLFKCNTSIIYQQQQYAQCPEKENKASFMNI